MDLYFRWISPVLLLVDQYERISVSSQRKAQLLKIVVRRGINETLHSTDLCKFCDLKKMDKTILHVNIS